MKTLKITATLFSVAFLLLVSTSCKKKCKLDNSTVDSGTIIEDVVIYPTSGSMTGNMGGNYVIGASSNYADYIEISFSEGPREAVNYANYKVLAFPVSAKCNAQYERNVTVNSSTQSVVYSIKVTQCSDCKEVRNTENYVLVPTFPDNYTVTNELTIIDKN
jgi:hypothetical protein